MEYRMSKGFEIGHSLLDIGNSFCFIDCEQARLRGRQSKARPCRRIPTNLHRQGDPAMALITWSVKYSVGVEEMDKQHRRLIDLLNLLHETMLAGKGKEIIGSVLEDLISYTLDHFSSEEQFMGEIHFPGLVTQRYEHASLRQKALDINSDFNAGKVSVTVDLLNFLKDWVNNHILESDMKYGEHYARNYAGQ
jgi:hemerythrin